MNAARPQVDLRRAFLPRGKTSWDPVGVTACICTAFVLFVALLPCVIAVWRGQAPERLLCAAALAVAEAALFASVMNAFEESLLYDVALMVTLPSSSGAMIVASSTGLSMPAR